MNRNRDPPCARQVVVEDRILIKNRQGKEAEKEESRKLEVF